MESNFSVLSSTDCLFGVKFRSCYLVLDQIFCPIFFGRSFIVLHFTCKFIINYKLIFVLAVIFRLKFFPFFLNLWIAVALALFVEQGSFPSLNVFFHVCQASVGQIGMGLFLGSPFSSIDLCVYLCQLYTVLIIITI